MHAEKIMSFFLVLGFVLAALAGGGESAPGLMDPIEPTDPWIGRWEIDFSASSLTDFDSVLLEGLTGAITYHSDGTYVLEMALASIGYVQAHLGYYVVADDIMASYLDEEMDIDRFTLEDGVLTLTSMTTGDVLVMIKVQ